MEPNATKSKRRRVKIKMTGIKPPGMFTQLLGKIFGSDYLENSRLINFGIIFGIAFFAVIILVFIFSQPESKGLLPKVGLED